MHSINDLTTEAVLMTPQLARTLRETCHFERQRPLAPRNIERLKIEMAEGRFVAGTPIFICVLPDKSMRLVNGNHTLEAVAAHGAPVPLSVVYLKVKNLAEVGEIYATFDIHKMRSWGDALRAVGMTDDFPLATKVASAVGHIMGGYTDSSSNVRARQSRGARTEAMADYRAAAEAISIAIAGTPRINQRLILRAPVLAVALETARYQPTKAYEFWGGVAKDNALVSADPRKALLRYLLNTSSAHKQDRRTQALAAANAWNAFFEGREMEFVRPDRRQTEVRLKGTPGDEKKRGRPANKVPLIHTGVLLSANGEQPVATFAG